MSKEGEMGTKSDFDGGDGCMMPCEDDVFDL